MNFDFEILRVDCISEIAKMLRYCSIKCFSVLYYLSRIQKIEDICYVMKNSLKYLVSRYWRPGPGCSKLTTSLVNVSLKFQMLIS